MTPCRRRVPRRWFAALLALLVFCLPAARAQQAVQVEALLPGMAVLTIDGQRHTLRAGESGGGVTLVSASAQEAVLEIGGVHRRAGVSERVTAAYREPERRRVTIPRNDNMQYRTTAEINGRRLEVLVDTGANIVAMNRNHALTLGVDPAAGEATRVETAGSTVAGRIVVLDSVDVGGIRVDNVRATVIDGNFPRTVLLGMTFLSHVELSEENGVLSLSSRW
jgi:aspartyl protease family protein